jgi:hypothetical protein
MAINQTTNVNADTLKSDSDALVAIKNLGDYKPANSEFSLDNLQAFEAQLLSAAKAFAQAEAAWQTARDANVQAQWAFHNAILGAKRQILAQYGDDSHEAQAVGLTRKSERSRRGRKPAAEPAAKAA